MLSVCKRCGCIVPYPAANDPHRRPRDGTTMKDYRCSCGGSLGRYRKKKQPRGPVQMLLCIRVSDRQGRLPGI